MDKDKNKMNNNLRNIRSTLGISQKQLADLLKTNQTTVASWETRGNIPAKWIPKIAELLNVSLEQLHGIDPQVLSNFHENMKTEATQCIAL